MDGALYLIALACIKLLQRLPLRVVARIGRLGGTLAYFLDVRHRRVALENLELCFGSQMSRTSRVALARENFRRIGENFASAIKTASMTLAELKPHIEFVAPTPLTAPDPGLPTRRVVVAIGHFGNFELYARFGQLVPAYQCATTYRGLRQSSLNRLMQSLRERSGCLFFERRFDGQALKSFMQSPGVMLGLLADQHAGDNGLRLPFLGQECSTTSSPAVFALRYDCALYTGICYRVGLAQWRVEAGEEIPTHVHGKRRAASEIMAEVNRAFEQAVRRDPANWFWVHKRWKLAPLSSPAKAGSHLRASSAALG